MSTASRTPGRYVILPCGLAGSRWEPAAVGLCGAALGGVFGTEVLTPDDVTAALGLPPLLAATWTLSGRMAAAVSAFALALFGVVVAVETPNRGTVLAIGASGVILAVAVRICATRLADTLSRRGDGRLFPPAPRLTSATIQGLDSLTRRELEVARLASQGYTAAEIASGLHISDRTVETHLVHVYSKLGVTSKRALIRMNGSLTVPYRDNPADGQPDRPS